MLVFTIKISCVSLCFLPYKILFFRKKYAFLIFLAIYFFVKK